MIPKTRIRNSTIEIRQGIWKWRAFRLFPLGRRARPVRIDFAIWVKATRRSTNGHQNTIGIRNLRLHLQVWAGIMSRVSLSRPWFITQSISNCSLYRSIELNIRNFYPYYSHPPLALSHHFDSACKVHTYSTREKHKYHTVTQSQPCLNDRSLERYAR